MSLKKDFFDHLNANAGLTTEVGNRIFPHFGPTDAALPYITYEVIANPNHDHLTAASGIASTMFQLDVWASTSISLESTIEAVRNAVDGFQGDMGTTNVRRIILQTQRDDTDAPDDGSENITFRSTLDLMVWHFRAVPTL